MRRLILGLSMLFLVTPVIADDSAPAVAIKNARVTTEGILTGGQPSVSELSALKAAGYNTIINLRPEAEVKRAFTNTQDASLHYDERAIATKLGIKYISLPIGSAEDLTADTARLLDQILQNLGDGVVLHCASGNRVGALMALRAFHIQNQSPEQSLLIGRNAGLTKLEPVVIELLSKGR